MMRIVLATTARQRGGVWRHIMDVAAGLRQRGHDIEIELDPKASMLCGEASRQGFTVREPSSRPAPDVWHLHLADTYSRESLWSLVSARRSGAVVVVTEHLPRTDASDPSARSHSTRSRPGSWPAKTAFKRLQFSLCDRIVVVSDASRRFLLTRYGVDPHKVVTIPNGVGPCDVEPSSPETPPRFVAVGSVIAQKGFDLLVDAAALADATWSLEVVGDGPHRVELQERASTLARSVRFVGLRPDVAGTLRSATALVMPSRWEAWPYAAMEAMQQGVAVVAARVDGLPEIVHEGATGILVEPESPCDLAKALDRLADDPRLAEAMGKNGQRRVALFDDGSMLDALMRAYTGRRVGPRGADLVGIQS